jgi:PAS domain S-box-containing protein
MTFLSIHRDFLQFVPLFAFILCGVECVVLSREESRDRRWLSFFAFFFLQGISAAWILWTLALPGAGGDSLGVPLLQAFGYGSLYAFGSPPDASARRKRLMVVLTLALIGLCAAAGVLRGAAAASFAAQGLLALPGAVFAVRFMLSDPALRTRGRPWLVGFAVTFAAFALVSCAGAVTNALFGGWGRDPALLAQAVVSLGLAFTLSMHQWRSFARQNRGFGSLVSRMVIYGSFLSLPLLLAAGGVGTELLGRYAAGELSADSNADTEMVRSTMEARIGEVDRDVSLLSRSPLILPLFLREDQGARAQALDVLNRFAGALEADCVLLDRRGVPLAWSRGSPGAFTRAAHAGTAWFTEALGGGSGRHFTVDPVSRARGYHSSAPVWDLERGIVGVAVVTRNMDSILPSAIQGEAAFLVDEDGLVFFSTRRDLLYRPLWPVEEKKRRAIAADPERGFISGLPIMARKPADQAVVPWGGADSLVTRKFLSVPGWSVVQIGSLLTARQYRLAGLLGTLVVVLVIAVFSAAGQLSLLGEARVERSEAQYRALVEGAPDWISIVDAGGRFMFTNAAGRASLGMEGAGSAGDGRMERLLGQENMRALAGQVDLAMRGSIVSLETPLPSADGEVKVWRLTLVPLRREGTVDGAILIGNDVSEGRRAQARLVRAERLAALGTLAAGVAHHFNNINAVALGYLEILGGEKGLGDSARGYLRAIEDALHRSVEITTHLLPLTTAGGPPEPAVSLSACVDAVLPALRPELEREQVTLALDLGETPALAVNGAQLQFVVREILGNAAHALLGMQVRRIEVRTGTRDDQVFFQVRDTGIGIAPERMSGLFTPFFSGKGEHAPSDSSQTRVRGVGLSLAVAHSIIAAWGGRIEAESTSGAGSTFTVWLPTPLSGE